MEQNIGIVAGSGALPFITVKKARQKGITKIYAVAFKGQTDERLIDYVDGLEWIGLGQLGKLISFFKDHNVTRAIFIGKIAHKVVLKNIKLDMTMLQLAMRIKDWRTDSILSAIADEITRSGIEVIDSTTYLKDLLPEPGLIAGKKLTPQQEDDVRFGFFIAKNLAGLDVGQTVVVKKKTVLALEAIEGTDETIRRGGSLGKTHVVVVKVSKPSQDMRFDVPVIGETTLQVLAGSNASVLAVEAGRTLVIDREKLIEQAKKHKVSLVAIDPKAIDTTQFKA